MARLRYKTILNFGTNLYPVLACYLPAIAIDLPLAARYFQEARWISEDDGGSLWGRRLYGPMVFVDPKTRDAVANGVTPDGFGPDSGVFVGKMGREYPVANTSFDWKGQKWTMVMWPLPVNRADRATLMMHECYHRIQNDLGWPGGSPQNAHLESLDGRLWLQLELRALERALAATEANDRDAAATDALAFRGERYRSFPKAKPEEDSLELNEGLAEFTGYMLRGGSERESRLWLAKGVGEGIGLDTYARRFPYLTGAAYAMLLNADEAGWRKALKPDFSLAGFLQAHLRPPSLRSAEVLGRAKRYGYDGLRVTETERAMAHAKRVAEIRKRLIDGPVLRIEFVKMRISFNPNEVVPLGDQGTYYPTATIIDEWGNLEVMNGVLVGADWRSARVVASQGKDWKLSLTPGWQIVPGKRKEDLKLEKKG